MNVGKRGSFDSCAVQTLPLLNLGLANLPRIIASLASSTDRSCMSFSLSTSGFETTGTSKLPIGLLRVGLFLPDPHHMKSSRAINKNA
jgi:hypothetical protein